MKKTLIPVFPGTNCEKESFLWIEDNLETKVDYLDLSMHLQLQPADIDFILIPGGFSYGDYLRAGAIASRSAEMKFIVKLADENVPIIGICNGFQILCEAGLLPGTLVKNITHRHHHFPVSIKIDASFLSIENQKKCLWIPKINLNNNNFKKYTTDFKMPMSCGMGNWVPPIQKNQKEDAIKQAVVFYNNNENGSFQSIAALTNKIGNILGMMPHPERASDSALGDVCGLIFLLGISQSKNIAIKKNSELCKFQEKLLKGILP